MREEVTVPPDATRTESRPQRLTGHEARRRLEHARDSGTAQLRALGENGQSADDHVVSTRRETIQRVLVEIEEALARVDDGSYGTCLGCSRPVPAERLEILPYTRYCVSCRGRAAA